MNRRFTRNIVWLIPIAVTISLVLVFSVVAAADLTDDSIANFTSGTLGTCGVSPSAGDAGIDGEVVLGLGAGGMLETFAGAILPTGWTSDTYTLGTGGITVTADLLTLDGYHAGPSTSAAPRTIDFVANFSAPRQHAGLANDQSLNSNSWAMFSTSTTTDTLYAWTSNGTPISDTLESLGTGYFNAFHRYRIEWTTTSVLYYIDGSLVATHTTPTINQAMAPVVSDVTSGDAPLVVDWMRMGDYISTCTFESRVFDGGQLSNTWQILTPTVFMPLGTSISYATRTGDTPTPDGSWSGYQAVTGGIVSSPDSRYIQYQAVLNTSDVRFTPELRKVVLSGQTPTSVTLSTLTAQTHGLPALPLLALTTLVSLIVVSAVVRHRRL